MASRYFGQMSNNTKVGEAYLLSFKVSISCNNLQELCIRALDCLSALYGDPKKDEDVEVEGQKSLKLFSTVTLIQEQAQVIRTVPYHLTKTSRGFFVFGFFLTVFLSVMSRETVTSEQTQFPFPKSIHSRESLCTWLSTWYYATNASDQG